MIDRAGVKPRRALRGAVLSLIAAVVAVFAVQSPSWADEDYYDACRNDWVTCQTGVQVAGPPSSGGDCGTAGSDSGRTVVCVVYDGESVYVKDGMADGYAAMARISYENVDVDSKNIRFCRNNYGNGSWARCNFDWNEGVTKSVDGGYKQSYEGFIITDYLWSFSGK
jgi:hypothetical protein